MFRVSSVTKTLRNITFHGSWFMVHGSWLTVHGHSSPKTFSNPEYPSGPLQSRSSRLTSPRLPLRTEFQRNGWKREGPERKVGLMRHTKYSSLQMDNFRPEVVVGANCRVTTVNHEHFTRQKRLGAADV
jgi:hypothetical protein